MTMIRKSSDDEIAAGRDRTAPIVRIWLLGGFRVEREGKSVPEQAWQKRRAAKSLIKLLAIEPGHSLHREQVLDVLWPETEMESSLNSLSKALHAARHALEPEMPRGAPSSYIYLCQDILTLDANRIWIDVDHFQSRAEPALARGDVASIAAALDLYKGELLPEDRYEDWAGPRRQWLSELCQRLRVKLADAFEQRGWYRSALEQLMQALQQDPVREDVHRRLMRLYAQNGDRHQALRQYQLCRDLLRRELDVEPEPETEALYQDIIADRVQERTSPTDSTASSEEARLPPAIRRAPSNPLVGRAHVMEILTNELARAEGGSGSTVLVSGEAGVGKSRLVADLAREAASRHVTVLWGASYEQESLVPYGPFVVALESYAATCSMTKCQALAAQYPELVRLVPSLAVPGEAPPGLVDIEVEHCYLFAAIARLLSDLAAEQSVLIVLDDLHLASRSSIQLVQHLAHLAGQRRLLVIGTYCEEESAIGGELQQMLIRSIRGGLCRHVNLGQLHRQDCDEIVRVLLPDGTPISSLLEQIYALTLGNPLFIEEVVGAMRGRGEVVLADGYWQPTSSARSGVPRQVQKMVDARIYRMDMNLRRVLTLGAIIGSQFSFSELQAARGGIEPQLTDEELLDALDRALEANVLEERLDGYAFRYPLFQAALHDHVSGHRRTRVQASLKEAAGASALGQMTASQERGEADGGKDHGLTPGHAPNFSAPGTGTFGRELVERLDDFGHTLQSARVLHKLATVFMELGEDDHALLFLERVADIYESLGEQEGLKRVAEQIIAMVAHRPVRPVPWRSLNAT